MVTYIKVFNKKTVLAASPFRWQTSWGMTALPNYTALIIGLIGVAMYQPQTLEVGLGLGVGVSM